MREARADAAARAAVAERDRAARAAAEAEAAAEAQLAAAQGTFDAAAAEKAALDEQLREAEIRLLRAAGRARRRGRVGRDASRPPRPPPSMLAAAGGAVAPDHGAGHLLLRLPLGHAARRHRHRRARSAPRSTRPRAASWSQAGPASGFGLAVAVQHGDGTITLYGHVNQFFVSAGQAVTAGQQIAEVGNRGQSTGPHLHFEVHTGGLYANRVNPAPWLTARGISLGGC